MTIHDMMNYLIDCFVAGVGKNKSYMDSYVLCADGMVVLSKKHKHDTVKR